MQLDQLIKIFGANIDIPQYLKDEKCGEEVNAIKREPQKEAIKEIKKFAESRNKKTNEAVEQLVDETQKLRLKYNTKTIIGINWKVQHQLCNH